MLGEEGSEQFTIRTTVDDKEIGHQKIHDPFIRNKTVIGFRRWELVKAFFKGKLEITVRVNLYGTPGAERAIMTLDPAQLTKETDEILSARQRQGEIYEAMGLVTDTEELKAPVI